MLHSPLNFPELGNLGDGSSGNQRHDRSTMQVSIQQRQGAKRLHPQQQTTAIFICIYHALNSTPYTHLGETVAYSIENCCMDRRSALKSMGQAIVIASLSVANNYLTGEC
ncbi:hypothetical protein IQ268_15225 [Oculatella sp. LEGE 06141]|uniref:hypothetical protein n=1 Tax=Oculatella sp. LEGE 06141 TaxID=1828648 RepID=UPI00187E0382|nr:hypothetical protein [Oculatella sp. LEGE 06141]MBE9179922.1 hypothetical protein [Oculatella sp. LEGE 06141]